MAWHGKARVRRRVCVAGPDIVFSLTILQLPCPFVIYDAGRGVVSYPFPVDSDDPIRPRSYATRYRVFGFPVIICLSGCPHWHMTRMAESIRVCANIYAVIGPSSFMDSFLRGLAYACLRNKTYWVSLEAILPLCSFYLHATSYREHSPEPSAGFQVSSGLQVCVPSS